jgi:hypothetical protein
VMYQLFGLGFGLVLDGDLGSDPLLCSFCS